MRRVARRRGEVAVKGNGKGGNEGSSVEKRVGFGMRTRASSLMTMNDGDGHAALRPRLGADVDTQRLRSDMVLSPWIVVAQAGSPSGYRHQRRFTERIGCGETLCLR